MNEDAPQLLRAGAFRLFLCSKCPCRFVVPLRIGGGQIEAQEKFDEHVGLVHGNRYSRGSVAPVPPGVP